MILNGANLDSSGVKSSVQVPIILGYHMASLFSRVSVRARKNAELLRLMVEEPHIQLEELRKLSHRTLVIAGTRDMIREAHTRQMVEFLPHGELAILPGGHFLAKKSSEAFNRRVEIFLSKD